MKKNPITITVGIPAYNETANLQKLLTTVLTQQEESFVLEKIIVVADEYIMETERIISQVDSKIIQLIKREKRQGQTTAQNLIFSLSQSDICVLLEADTIPKNSNYLTNLIAPMLQNPAIGVVQGHPKALEANTLIGSMMKQQADIYHTHSANHKKIREWICTGRGGRAFAKRVYKVLVWPASVPEDDYALLWCKTNNIQTTYTTKAICCYRCPETIGDFLKERKKLNQARERIEQYFAKEDVNKLYSRPRILLLQMLLRFVGKNPLMFVMYLLLLLKVTGVKNTETFTDSWQTTFTTKITDI